MPVFAPSYNPLNQTPSAGSALSTLGQTWNQHWKQDYGMGTSDMGYVDQVTGQRKANLDDQTIRLIGLGQDQPTLRESTVADRSPKDMIDFPDVFGRDDNADAWIDRINRKDVWPLSKTMPLQKTDKLEFNWELYVFNNATPDRLPERSIPTAVNFTRDMFSARMLRYGKLAQMQKEAYHTKKGRVLFWYYVEQINNAFMFMMLHSVLAAIMYTKDPNVQQKWVNR